MIATIRERVKRYKPRVIESTMAVCAGVVIPLYEKDSEPFIILTKRSNEVRIHKGEVSFPGGMCEDNDENVMNTALRECCEEIGVRESDIEIIGRLDDMNTLTGFVITPYVGIIPYPYRFKTNPKEVAYLIELPISYLNDAKIGMEEAEYRNNIQIVHSFYYNGDRIWGATCRLLLQFRDIINGKTI
ncbi:MAG TPA: CoA pyrophosphatase [Syntrophorhabdaceae bacterium]|nr:CoA pyrophosphatase [Syntrophorhabdaceae bacterium]